MHKIIDIDSFIWLDFTAKNKELDSVDLVDTAKFSDYVFNKIYSAGVKVGVGGYMEHRVIYRRSEHFNKEETEPRCIHLGIDLWAEAGTPIYAPWDAKVHSFQNNDNYGDYGPTIILEHKQSLAHTSDVVYTLYGHLSLESLERLYEGKTIKEGERFADIGNFPINGDWPPHLHFQLMTDMLGMKGDFPGVCALSEKDRFQNICLNPNMILELEE